MAIRAVEQLVATAILVPSRLRAQVVSITEILRGGAVQFHTQMEVS